MMKKFYYKKEDTIDKTPMILERRNTVSQDGKEEVENRLSTRTNSLGSVDQLRDASLRPRIHSREVTKTLSEDVLSRCYMKNPGKVITERELAASKLYKMRKASINSKDSPQQVPQKDYSSPVTLKDPKFKPVPVSPRDRNKTDTSCLFPQQVTQKNDLSPVALKDPKFKPVPVPPKDRRKRESSCLCYLGIFMAISLCTIGVLAAVTGLLYSEIFSDKNSTSRRLQESMIDLTNLIENSSSNHEYHVINNETFARSVSFESADYDSSEIKKSGSNLIESEDNAVQFRQMDMTDLSRLIDNKKAEIKFQDRDTTIFEVNASSPAEQENNIDNLEVKEETIDAKINMISETDGPNILNIEHVSDDSSIIKNNLEETESPSIFDNVRQRENGDDITNIKQEIHDTSTDIEQTSSLYINENLQETEVPKLNLEKEEIVSRTLNMKQETDNFENDNLENDGSKNIIRGDFEVFDKKTEDEAENIKYIDELSNSQFNTLKDSSEIDLHLDLNLSDKKSSDEPADHSTSSITGTKLENQPATFAENTAAVIQADKNISKPSLKLNSINLEYQTRTVSLPKDNVVWKAGGPMKASNVGNQSELVDKEISSGNLIANASSKTENDVEAILEIINEPGDNVQDPFIVNRNGDIVVLETSSLGSKHNLNNLNVKSEDGNSSGPVLKESQSPQKDQMPKETMQVKSLNMKVSLAEAMKHLQTLDVNNKLLTSRIKSPKPKAQSSKPLKLSNKERKKENIGVERMQLLHNLRLALQGNLIGL